MIKYFYYRVGLLLFLLKKEVCMNLKRRVFSILTLFFLIISTAYPYAFAQLPAEEQIEKSVDEVELRKENDVDNQEIEENDVDNKEIEEDDIVSDKSDNEELFEEEIIKEEDSTKIEKSKVVKITFDSNGGSEVKDIEIPVGSSLDDNEYPIPKRKGYNFDGWEFDGKIVSAETKYVKDSKLKALWEEIVSFDKDNIDHLTKPNNAPIVVKKPFIKPATDFKLPIIKKNRLRGSKELNNPPIIGVDHPENPGDVVLFKEVKEIPDFVNTWEINLRIEAKNEIKTSDVVLVIDTSGSMGDNNRLVKAKEAANAFVDTLLEGDGVNTNRIAVVEFNFYPSIVQALTSDKTVLKSAINGLSANGGTYTQASVRTARGILDSSTADYKNIVLLSDGEPTYSYGMNDPNSHLSSQYIGKASHGSTSTHMVNGNRLATDVVTNVSDFTNSRVGNGRAMFHRYDNPSGTSNDKYYNHGNGAISEAGFAKNDDYSMWCVGLQTNTVGEEVLTQMADTNQFYQVNDVNDLQPVFESIAGSIKDSVQNATVNDPMGGGFNVPIGEVSNISTTQGTAVYDSNTRTIDWDIGTLANTLGTPNEDIKYAHLTYQVEINDDILNETATDGTYATNGDTQVTYTDPSGNEHTGTFPVPRVNPILLIVEKVLVDSHGNTVTSDDREFNVHITSTQGYDKTYTVKAGEKKVMTNLRLTDNYKVVEDAVTGGGNLSDYDINYNIYGDDTDEFVIADHTDPDTNVIVTNTEKKLGKLTIKKVFRNNPLDSSTLCSNFVTTIFEDSFGILWLGTTNGLARFDRETETFQCIAKKRDGTVGLSGVDVTSMMEDGQGNLFIGTRDGLDFLDRREQKVIHYLHKPGDPKSISSNNINCCMRDRSGAFWVGTVQGISKFSYLARPFDLYESLPGVEHSLVDNSLRCIISDKHQNIWIGTKNDGIDRFDISSGMFYHYHFNNPEKNRILTSYFSESAGILFGTEAGILKYNAQINDFELFDFDGKYTFSNRGVYEIVEDRNENLYFSEMDKGIVRYNAREKTIEELNLQLENVDPSRGRNIKIMHFDKSGNLWFSIQMEGVGRYNPETGVCNRWKSGENGLKTNKIWDIFENEYGIWLGTENGLFLYADSINMFKEFNIQHGLPGNIIVSILEDDSKHLWLGTNKGLSCFDLMTKTFRNYSISDGLQGEIFEYKVKQKVGKLLLFGGNNGLNVFNPGDFELNTYVPSPGYTALNIAKHLVTPGQVVESNVPLECSMVFEDQIRLKDSHRNIEIEFSAFSYINSYKNIYKYCFSGKDDTTAWHFTRNNQNSVFFPRLKPGDYQLLVKAANCDGVWSEQPISLKIKVTRDLKKIAGYVSNIFLLLVIVGILFYFRKSLKRMFSELNRKYRQPVPGQIYPRFKLDPNLDTRTKKNVQMLIDSMEKEQLYLDKRLTKNQLAAHLKLSLAQLSSLLKEQLDIGFNDFVNYYRVEAVKKMMNDPKNKDFTFLSIAGDCGFNSKTSFYRIFKNFIGLTPAEYHDKYISTNKEDRIK